MAQVTANSTESLKCLLRRRPSLSERLAEAMAQALAVGETGGAHGRPLFPPQLRLIREVCRSARFGHDDDDSDSIPAALSSVASQGQQQQQVLRRVESFLAFNDKLVSWVPTLFDDKKELVMTNVYNHLLAQHFVFTQSAPGQALVHDADFCGWMAESAHEWGDFCDSVGSITSDSLVSMELSQSAMDPDFRMNMEQYLVPPSGFQTWNQLFARHTAPAWRPVDHQDKPDTVVTSPADCVFKAWYDIDMTGRVGHWDTEDRDTRRLVQDTCTVKGKTYGTIQELLGCATADEFEAAEQFFGGRFFHSFLGPADYHRFRAPVRGFVRESKVITGHVFLEVQSRAADEAVGEDPAFTYFSAPARTEPALLPSKQNRTSLSIQDGPNSPTLSLATAPALRRRRSSTIDAAAVAALASRQTSTWQFEQQRGLLLLDTAVGPVAVLPVGMASVSGVNMTAKKGSVLAKGEEFGYFTFGGSDIITVYAPSHATGEVPFRPARRYIPRPLQPTVLGSMSCSRWSEGSAESVASAKARKCLACTFIGVMDPASVDSTFDPFQSKGRNVRFRVPRRGVPDLDAVSSCDGTDGDEQ